LFDTLDPSPFREKDRDRHVEDFIVSWARELHTDLPFTIVVHLPEKQRIRPEAKDIGPAIKGFFAYTAQETGLKLKELFRIGRRSLAIGMAILVVSIVASQMVAAKDPVCLGCELAANRDLSLRMVADRSAASPLSEACGSEG
jgi:hypothetical protein